MLHVLTRMAREEANRVARDAVRRLVFLVIALIFVFLALVFAGLALFLWLSEIWSPPVAGAAVAGVALVIALIALLLTGSSGSRAAEKKEDAPLSPEEKRIAEAEALGMTMGRDLKGLPLVVTALAVGMLVGRMRK